MHSFQNQDVTLVVPERSRSVIKITDPDGGSQTGSPGHEGELHKPIERCASENNAKDRDYTLAENINW